MPDKLKTLWSGIAERVSSKKAGTLALYLLILLVGTLALGTLVRVVAENMGSVISGAGWSFRPHILLEPPTWGIGFVFVIVLTACYMLAGGFAGTLRNGLLGGKSGDSLSGDILKIRVDARPVRPGAYKVARGLGAQYRVKGADYNGLSGAGLAGHTVQAVGKSDIRAFNNGYIFNFEV